MSDKFMWTVTENVVAAEMRSWYARGFHAMCFDFGWN